MRENEEEVEEVRMEKLVDEEKREYFLKSVSDKQVGVRGSERKGVLAE